MAIYHMTSKIIGKSKGRSAVAAAAYRSGDKLVSQSYDLVFDYTKKRGVSYSEILAPVGAPEWVQDREILWNTVERSEKRKDAQYCREIEVALPIELTFEQNKMLLKEFVQTQFVSHGMIADFAMHDIDKHNPHAHILLTTRSIDQNGFGKKVTAWNDRGLYGQWREEWANTVNRHLTIHGYEMQIDHRSYAEQGIDLEPTIHLGIQRDDRQEQERFQKQQNIKMLNAERIIQNPHIALELLAHQKAVFTHQDIAILANTHSSTVEDFERVRHAVQQHPGLIRLGIGADNREYYTTQQMLDWENDLLTKTHILSQRRNHFIAEKKLNFVLAGKTLNLEQKQAFKYIVEGQDLSLVVGFAGTGKSYLMDAVREAYESQGYSVTGVALSGRAAENLSQGSSIKSHTIARTLLDWKYDRERLTKKSVLVLDEAGMVGTRQWVALVEEAHRAGAKVIVIGDPEQLQPIEAGNPLRFLLERHTHKTLSNVMRQKVDWQKQATVELSTRQTAKALLRYKEAGFIHEFTSRQESQQQLIQDWLKDRKTHSRLSQLIFAYSNRDVQLLNQLARDELKRVGELSAPSEKRAVIATSDWGELEFCVCDRILFLQNDNSLGVRNGFLGTVVDISRTTITVELDSGTIISFDPQQYNYLSHGYATTIHKSQGSTIDRTYILATPELDRFLTNVAMDRHREAVQMYYGNDDFRDYQQLSRKLSRGENKIMASEFAQARGIDYLNPYIVREQSPLMLGVESKLSVLDKLILKVKGGTPQPERIDIEQLSQKQLDSKIYWKELISESQPLKGTLAQEYLKQFGLGDIEYKTLRFHPSVWEKETQSFMPALIAKAHSMNEKNQAVEKGIQVTFLDPNTKKQASLKAPVRYAGDSKGTIVMIQKALKPDERWYVAMDVESALSIAKAKPEARVAYIAAFGDLKNIPLRGNGNDIILCTRKDIPSFIVQETVHILQDKKFNVFIAAPTSQKNHAEVYHTKGIKAVRENLQKTMLQRNIDSEIAQVINRFNQFDKKIEEAKKKSRSSYIHNVRENISNYVKELEENPRLIQKLKTKAPQICYRINKEIEKDESREC